MALPVSLAEAKRHLRITASSQDADVNDAILDAAGWVERYTGHLLTPRTVTEHFSGFQAVALRAWPIAADAAAGVAYLDDTDTPVAIPGARLNVSSRPAQVSPGTGHFWPFRDIMQRFTVTVTAGYATPADVPRSIRRAMLVMITAFYENRGGGDAFDQAEKAAKSLCGSLRLRRL